MPSTTEIIRHNVIIETHAVPMIEPSAILAPHHGHSVDGWSVLNLRDDLHAYITIVLIVQTVLNEFHDRLFFN
jgi:hypothetical protein